MYMYMYLAIRVYQTAGEFDQDGEKSKDTALIVTIFSMTMTINTVYIFRVRYIYIGWSKKMAHVLITHKF